MRQDEPISMYGTRLQYIQAIDAAAESIAGAFCNGEPITERILRTICSIYESAKVEQHFKDEHFDTAYHSPITGELEFLIARILYHYSQQTGKGWSIYLRRQESKTAPDIRLLKKGKTFAVIEVKAKAGWIQAFLSPERYGHDKQRLATGISNFNPDHLIANVRAQLTKYCRTFQLGPSDVFMLLPTLALVHRKKYSTDLEGYYSYFGSTSGLPNENLVLLSRDKRLDLSCSVTNLHATTDFEKLLAKLSAK
ncbi:MAG TPA: hypothetical protein VMR70_21405 [Flavisolibacter sp.]|nr:hypothetical protein [Flavisolibacter sp.]